MYKYELNMEEKRLSVRCDEEKVCDATIAINEDVATIKFDSISCKDSYVSVVSKICDATKTLLQEQGVLVSKAVVGDILAVARYDGYLNDQLQANEEIKIISKR